MFEQDGYMVSQSSCRMLFPGCCQLPVLPIALHWHVEMPHLRFLTWLLLGGTCSSFTCTFTTVPTEHLF